MSHSYSSDKWNDGCQQAVLKRYHDDRDGSCHSSSSHGDNHHHHHGHGYCRHYTEKIKTNNYYQRPVVVVIHPCCKPYGPHHWPHVGWQAKSGDLCIEDNSSKYYDKRIKY